MDFSKYKPASDAKFWEDEVLPKNTSKDSAAKSIGEGGQNGSILLIVEVNDAVTLAASKAITLQVLTSSDGSTWKVLESKTFSAAPEGQMLDYIFPPSTLGQAKLRLSTDDADAAGSVNAYLRYIPR